MAKIEKEQPVQTKEETPVVKKPEPKKEKTFTEAIANVVNYLELAHAELDQCVMLRRNLQEGITRLVRARGKVKDIMKDLKPFTQD